MNILAVLMIPIICYTHPAYQHTDDNVDGKLLHGQRQAVFASVVSVLATFNFIFCTNPCNLAVIFRCALILLDPGKLFRSSLTQQQLVLEAAMVHAWKTTRKKVKLLSGTGTAVNLRQACTFAAEEKAPGATPSHSFRRSIDGKIAAQSQL